MSEEIRVLIVDDHVQTLDTITRILQFESDIRIVGTAGTAGEGVELAKEADPLVILMDSHLPDMDVVDAIGAMLQVKPRAEIVLLAIEPDANFLRKAMRAGAADFLSKPPSTEALLKTIREAPDRREKKLARTGPLVMPIEHVPVAAPRVLGKLIAVYSGKGGVGCTTLATNLALQLHNEETPAVLMDADFQFGDVLVCLNQQIRFSIYDLGIAADTLDREIVDEVLSTHETGLRVLAAPPSPEDASGITEPILRRILAHLQSQFAYVIVDTASALDEVSLPILEMADIIVTLATPEITSIKNARVLLNALHALGISHDKVCLVFNQIGRRDGISIQSVQEHLKIEVAAELPFDRTVVVESINKGRPVVMNGRAHAFSKAMIGLVGAIRLQLLNQPEPEEA